MWVPMFSKVIVKPMDPCLHIMLVDLQLCEHGFNFDYFVSSLQFKSSLVIFLYSSLFLLYMLALLDSFDQANILNWPSWSSGNFICAVQIIHRDAYFLLTIQKIFMSGLDNQIPSAFSINICFWLYLNSYNHESHFSFTLVNYFLGVFFLLI